MRRVLFAGGVLLTLLAGLGTGRCQELAGPEQQAMADTLQYALEQNPVNEAAEWVNPDSGRAGVVVPTRTFSNVQGQPCREFTKTIIIDGNPAQGYGTACRQPDGQWQIVSSSRPTTVVTQPAPVYVHTPAERYYAYPAELYSTVPICLSFSYFHRHGRVYHGAHPVRGRDLWHRSPGHHHKGRGPFH